MGLAVTVQKINMQHPVGLMHPLIYCNPDKSMLEQAVPLNEQLAKALIVYRPQRRTMQIEKVLREIIAKLPENSVIRDFDALFNPAYKIDVLKVMIHICKTRPFSIIWPGTIEDNKLVYAEEGYQDYKTYNIADYDITCVI